MGSSSYSNEFAAVGGDFSPVQPAKVIDLAAIANAATSGWAGGITGTQGAASYVYTTQYIGDPLPANGSEVINEYTAMTIPAFLRGVRFLCETLAGFPKQVMQQTAPTVQSALFKNPLHYLLNREPNALQTAAVFWEVLFHHSIVWGNGYALVLYAPDGVTVTGIYNLPPDRVIPFRFGGRQFYALQIIDDFANPEIQWKALPAEYILHIPGFGFDGMRGYPLVEMTAEALRVGKAAEVFSAKFFKHGRAGLVMTRTDGTRLSNEQVEDLRHQIEQNQSGAQNGWRSMILPPGLDVKNPTLPNDSAQLLETKAFSIVDVARILGVEPFILYDYSRATWANLESMNTQVVQYSLMPWVTKAEQELTRKLLTIDQRRNKLWFIKFSLDSLTRGDRTQRQTQAVQRLGAGMTTVNEERALEDLAPFDDPAADKPRVAANTIPLQPGQAAAEPPPHITPPPQTPPNAGGSKP